MIRGGDRVRILTGGGGWGDPLMRDPLAVARDVRDGLLSVHEAATIYGVVLDPATDGVDSAATAGLRWAAR